MWAGRGPVRRRELRAAGMSEEEIRRAVTAGEITAACRGIYVPGDVVPQRTVRSPTEWWEQQAARHEIAVRGVLARLELPAVVSHVSAAVLHRMDVWDVPLTRVHLTRDRTTGARRGRDLHLHAVPLGAGEITEVRGVPVTTPARTVADVARTLRFEQAVVIADAALRGTEICTEDLRAAARPGRRRQGTAAALRVAAFGDGRAASPGESRSRVLFRTSGVPAPTLQREVRDPGGGWLATVDFWWDGRRPVVGEFDGEIKYGRLLRPGQEPGQAIVEEKIREDRLRDLGLQVVRWTWRDLAEPDPLLARLRHRLARR